MCAYPDVAIRMYFRAIYKDVCLPDVVIIMYSTLYFRAIYKDVCLPDVAIIMYSTLELYTRMCVYLM
jgi:hypothetical protein